MRPEFTVLNLNHNIEHCIWRYMSKIYLTITLLLALLGQGAYAQYPILRLNKRNTVVLRGVVSDDTVAALEIELMDISLVLKPTEIIYLVLDTPGGSVSAGSNLIDFVHGLPNQVKTISLFAASMGFHIAENLDERFILPSSTLMSHRASISGMGGQIPGDLVIELNYLLRDLNRMDRQAADRMSLSLKAYQHLIHDQMWLKGEEAVKMKAADRVIYARCDSSFAGSKEVELGNFMGIPVLGTMSNCPLITGIMNVHLAAPLSAKLEDRIDAKHMGDVYASDKSLFVKRYISPGKLLCN